MKKLVKALIRFYQSFLSSVNFGIHTCRYYPSCSEYTIQAIDRFGIIRGSFMGLFRMLRCNPFSKGGFDPVPEVQKKD